LIVSDYDIRKKFSVRQTVVAAVYCEKFSVRQTVLAAVYCEKFSVRQTVVAAVYCLLCLGLNPVC
jgi:metal-dependent HD superfamily phosphatase/phosphodiesterase